LNYIDTLDSYAFGIWVLKYNELYGSIGTLLILMFYIWINCMILLLGFELNATVNKLKVKINKLLKLKRLHNKMLFPDPDIRILFKSDLL
jgi:uncharacterized BrkB/YihY/UPF0761 family membrane protein